ncbi:MAG: PAS domain S-box protein [Haloplanus sp.]
MSGDVDTSECECFEHHPSGMVLLAPETGDITAVNDRAERLFDRSAAALRGERLCRHAVGETADAVRETLAAADDEADGGEVYDVEFAVDAGGARRWVEMRLRRGDVDGDAVDVATVTDVTERTGRRRALRRRQETYASLVNETHDSLLVVREGVCQFANRSFLDLTGHDRTDVVGHAFSEFVAPTDRDRVTERYRRRVAGEEVPRRYEIDVLTAGGDQRRVELDVSRIRYHGEDATLAAGRDVTERTAYKERLERTTRQREFLNKLFRHDVRNDLMVVEHYTSYLHEQVTGRVRDFASVANETTDNVLELVDNLDDIEDVLTDDGTVDVECVRLDRHLRRQVETRRTQYADATIAIDGDVPAVRVWANDLLGSVFRNLLNNAVQHNDGDPAVVVRARERDSEVVVEIADDGPGLSDAEVDRLVADDPDLLTGAGGSVGLYLVSLLVERYGGSVAVRDNDPQGTVVELELRAATADPPGDVDASASE